MSYDVIKVPAPKEVGEVNCILIRGEEPVLIDPGPDTQEALDAVRKGLERNGFSIEEIEKVLVTHPHSDHFGNARRVRELSGADICMHPDAARIVEDFTDYRGRQIEFFSEYFSRMGIRRDDLSDILEKGLPNTYRQDLSVDREIVDGDTIETGNCSLEVMKVEGHAMGSLCFRLDEDVIFTGDFMLPDITPNPMLMLPEEGSEPPSSLELYLGSLEDFRERTEEGYGGHEGLIDDVGERAIEIEKHHVDRKEAMFGQLEEGMTAFELMQKFFGDLPENQYFLGMAEVISHIRLMEEDGSVSRTEEDGVVVFRKN